ncbi:mechanosensitive ion channel family protein [Denitrobaculum tricleocarpae]|uniref:mechanosensitive ion channel family protein n=1 Tax=Denitrobaculum tricleocarpae TaxID=2591009 RepID=UPI0015D42618|nr:mechanosensitive ion channel family protein [Denitrobaculum tricleocarpae]
MRSLAVAFALFASVLVSVSTVTPVLAQNSNQNSNQTAAEKQAEAEALISRLSDREVRELLVGRLAEAEARETRGPEEFNPAVIIYRLQRDMGLISEEVQHIFAAVVDLPAIFPAAWARFSADRKDGGLIWFFATMTIAFGLGFLAESALRPVLMTRPGQGPQELVESTRRKVLTLGGVLLRRLLLLGVFVGVATAVFVVFFDTTQKDRIAFFFYLTATGVFRVSIAMSQAFHAPKRGNLRLPLYDDGEAAYMHRTFLITVGFGAFAFFTCALFGTLGILGYVHELFLILVGTTTVSLLIYTIISGRSLIRKDIQSGAPPESPRARFARAWPWIFAVFTGFLWVGIVVRELLYDFVPYGAALFTIGLFAVIPSLDALFYRDAARFEAAADDVRAALARAARLTLLVVVTVSLASAWRINPLTMSDGGYATLLAEAAMQVAATLLVAYGIWQAVRIYIDRKIAEEDAEFAAQGHDPGEAEIGGTGMSRMRTLFPLFKRSVQMVLGIIVIMILLSSLGVDIAPILAGAGVVGLAIGFGSQTLVRDIVSGAFFLIDDAFRLGEYIDVGSVQGTVEKISLRSFRLRHHRGAIHTVPFGTIDTLTNYSRDWVIMKLKFRVPFDTDVRAVKKIFKKIGAELLEHPEIGEDFLQPFKSQGVFEVDDYGLVIRAKFTAKPGRQFMIRKEAYIAVQEAFAANGIEFARPEIKVTVEDEQDDDDIPATTHEKVRAAAAGGGTRLISHTAADAAEKV